MWHMLDTSSVSLKEFASALAFVEPALGWVPRMSTVALSNGEIEQDLEEPKLRVHNFALQRGYYRFPISFLSGFGARQCHMLERHSPASSSQPLICTSPFYAPVAERWKGPVIYYITDWVMRYESLNPRRVKAMEARMCKAAAIVCPNSERIADYLKTELGCASEKITVVPNATRHSNILPKPALRPAELPADIADLRRPVAGVIGNLAANSNWDLLKRVIEATPWLSWVFVGPADMAIRDERQRRMREHLVSLGGQVRFIGARPYGLLKSYSRAFDVAVLPYLRQEPTYSGSATRFYEHLAACRPILSTRGVEQLHHKEPLLKLLDRPEEYVVELERLRDCGFRDGLEELRWKASQNETWTARALTIRAALNAACGAGNLDHSPL